MKVKIAVLALFLFTIAACTQRTCPTYTKDNVNKTKKTEEKV